MRLRHLILVTLACAGCSSSETTAPTSSSSSSSSGSGGGVVCPTETDDELPSPPRHTARWAFEPWISKDISDTDDTRAFVKGFQDRDIPIGVVVLDSPWETNYNSFVPNPKRYHGFDALVGDLHQQDIRLVLWITAFINRQSFDLETGGDTYPSPSPNYDQGVACHFFVDDGTPYGWWKGSGGSVDFFNGAARAWYHRIQDPLFDQKIDGYKLDFGDSYVRSDPVDTAAGKVAHQKYSEAYYHDFLAYGVKRRGPDFVTMNRAYDVSYEFEGRFFSKKEDSPVAWMGDNRRDYIGLTDALDEMFRSAVAGYVVLGSDIGGYLDRDDKDLTDRVPFDTEVFARWTAIGGLSPFMQLHGRANISPWTVPDHVAETVAVYRYWAKLHHELVPFWYSLAEEAYAGAAGIVRPEGADSKAWAHDYRYRLGDAFLVAPLLDGTGKRDVALPAAEGWYDFWNPLADAVSGGQTLADVDATDRQRVPLFIQKGAIVPMSVDDDATSFGDVASAGHLTLLVYPSTSSSFRLHDADDKVTRIDQSSSGGATTISLSRAQLPVLLRVRDDGGFAGVTLDGAAATELATRAEFDAGASGFWRDPGTRSIWVHLPKSASSQVVKLGAP